MYYDVDWLRVVAVFSVIALHSSIIFSFGQFDVKHTQHTLTVDTIETYIDIWVIPLLFVLAGAATKFALDLRTSKAYSAERVKRLLVPFGIWFVVPLVAAIVFGWDFLFQLPGNPHRPAVTGIALAIMIVFMKETNMQIDSRVYRILDVFSRWCWVIAS